MTLQTLYFVLPGDRDLPSGGNLYNKFLMRSLRHAGIKVRHLDFADFSTDIQRPSSAFFVDSLLLSSMHRLRHHVPHSFFVVHSLRSLDPLLTAHARDRQIDREMDSFKQFAGFLVASGFSRDILRHWHGVTQPILVVPPALTLTPPAPAVERTGCRALIVANLIRSKAVLEFLRELADKLTAEDSFTLTVVGRSDIEADYATACLHLIFSHPALKARVRYLGTLPAGKMRELYLQSTLFISSSLVETYGMALAEARAFGLPIFAFDGGNVSAHVVPGVNGRLSDSIPDLVQSFLEVCRNPSDLQQFQARAYSSRQFETYSWHDAAQSLLQQLNAIPDPQIEEAN